MEEKFEKKFVDKLLPLNFKINHWLLRKIGLWDFGFLAFLYGVFLTILFYEFFKSINILNLFSFP